MTPRKKPASPRATSQPCAVAGCTEPGEFKAPASRESLDKHQFLCLEHVKKFNQAWDYFGGWDRDEIEAFMHSSVHGHRPTWSVHHLGSNGKSFTTEALEAALARMLGENAQPKRKPETKAERQRREALAVLNLPPDVDNATIKSNYKMLVKKYHPDVNSGKEAEDTFKRIADAYLYLTKKSEK